MATDKRSWLQVYRDEKAARKQTLQQAKDARKAARRAWVRGWVADDQNNRRP